MALQENITTFVDHYLAAKGDRPATLRWYRNRLEQFRRWVEKRENADIEDAGMLDAYVASLYARGLKQSTVNGHVRVLRAFYKYLVARDIVCYNAASGLRQKRLGPCAARDLAAGAAANPGHGVQVREQTGLCAAAVPGRQRGAGR